MRATSKSSEVAKALAVLSLEKFATTTRADFRFAPFNVLLLVVIYVIGLVVHLLLHPFSVEAVGLSLGSALCLAMLLRVTQVWEAMVILGTADGLVIYLMLRPESEVLLATVPIALLIACSIQIAFQWERAVLLRFGKFKGLRPSGVFMVMPVIDKVAQFVDQRIRVSDFSAETTLTADTVPVSVDAIAFWMVWDAQKAVLEVEHFQDAVVLSAQTALRNAIGKHDLAELLSERDRLGGGDPEGPGRKDQRLGRHDPGRRDPRHHHSQGPRGRHVPPGPGGARAAEPHHPRHGGDRRGRDRCTDDTAPLARGSLVDRPGGTQRPSVGCPSGHRAVAISVVWPSIRHTCSARCGAKGAIAMA